MFTFVAVATEAKRFVDVTEVAVIVPITWRAVDGVVVPMPTLSVEVVRYTRPRLSFLVQLEVAEPLEEAVTLP